MNEVRFSTDAQPESERLRFFHDVFGGSLLKVELSPMPGRPFRECGTFHTFDSLGVLECETNGNVSRRTKGLLGDSNDDLLFVAVRSGYGVPSQCGREFKLPQGSAAMLTAGEPGQMTFPEQTRFMCLRIPRLSLGGLITHPENALMREVPAKTEALRLLLDYVTMTLGRHELTSAPLRQLFAMSVRDLVALSLGANREGSELAHRGGLRTARLSAIKRGILGRLGNERLAVTDVARWQGVTPRYVQRLFESEGTTFSEYLVTERLRLARRMLAEPSLTDRTIASIAYEAGFGNLSHFNHMFRRAYGMTPSDVRAKG